MRIQFNNRTKTAIIAVLVIFILIIMSSIRYINNPNLPGDDTYYHLNIVNALKSGEKISSLYNGGYTLATSFDIFLYLLSLAIGVKAVFLIAPLIIGILTLAVLFLILKEVKVKTDQRFYTLLFFILSPIFIFSVFFINSNSFYLLISMAALYLIMLNNKTLTVISIILYLLLIFSNLLTVIINLFLLLGYASYDQKRRKLVIGIIFLITSGFLVYCSSVNYYLGTPEINRVFQKNMIQEYLTDLGGLISFSTFSIILSLFGLYFLYKTGKKYLPLILIIFGIFLLSFFSNQVNIFLNILIVILSAYAFNKLLRMKWSKKIIKNAVILSLFLGILFSTYSYSTRIISEIPTQEMAKSLEFLKEYSTLSGNVLSHYSRGDIIQYFSGQKVIFYPHYLHRQGESQRLIKAQEIFQEDDLESAKEKLKEYKIGYIYIDEEMKNSLVWSKPNQGLLFLFRNNETFKKIYSKDGIEIIKVIDQS
ncbi:MAG: hypothetical protein V1740_03125 [Candidatus Woesearchaeota archaeon]